MFYRTQYPTNTKRTVNNCWNYAWWPGPGSPLKTFLCCTWWGRGWFQNGRNSVQVNGQLFIEAWTVLQQTGMRHCGSVVKPSAPPACLDAAMLQLWGIAAHISLFSSQRACLSPLLGCRTGSGVSGGGSSSPKSGLCYFPPRTWGSGDPAAACLTWSALKHPRQTKGKHISEKVTLKECINSVLNPQTLLIFSLVPVPGQCCPGNKS